MYIWNFYFTIRPTALLRVGAVSLLVKLLGILYILACSLLNYWKFKPINKVLLFLKKWATHLTMSAQIAETITCNSILWEYVLKLNLSYVKKNRNFSNLLMVPLKKCVDFCWKLLIYTMLDCFLVRIGSSHLDIRVAHLCLQLHCPDSRRCYPLFQDSKFC